MRRRSGSEFTPDIQLKTNMPTAQARKPKMRPKEPQCPRARNVISESILNMLDKKIQELDMKSKSYAGGAKECSKQKACKKRRASGACRGAKVSAPCHPVKSILRKPCEKGKGSGKKHPEAPAPNDVCYYTQASPAVSRKSKNTQQQSRDIYNGPFHSVPLYCKESHVRFQPETPTKRPCVTSRNLSDIMKKYPFKLSNRYPGYTRSAGLDGRTPSCPTVGMNVSFNKSTPEAERDGIKNKPSNYRAKFDHLFMDQYTPKRESKCVRDAGGCSESQSDNNACARFGSPAKRISPQMKTNTVDSIDVGGMKDYISRELSMNKFKSSNPFSSSALNSRFPGSSKLYQSSALRASTYGKDVTSSLSSVSRSVLGKFTGYKSLLSEQTRERLGMDTTTPSFYGCVGSRDFKPKSSYLSDSSSYSNMSKIYSANNSNISQALPKASGSLSSSSMKSLNGQTSSMDTFRESYLTDRRKTSGTSDGFSNDTKSKTSEKDSTSKCDSYSQYLKDFKAKSCTSISPIRDRYTRPEVNSSSATSSGRPTSVTSSMSVKDRLSYTSDSMSYREILDKSGQGRADQSKPTKVVESAVQADLKKMLARLKDGIDSARTIGKSTADGTGSRSEIEWGGSGEGGGGGGGKGISGASKVEEIMGKMRSGEFGGKRSTDAWAKQGDGPSSDVMGRIGDLESILKRAYGSK